MTIHYIDKITAYTMGRKKACFRVNFTSQCGEYFMDFFIADGFLNSEMIEELKSHAEEKLC